MELIDKFMIWTLRYFDIYRASGRKEFNFTIFIYSILLLIILFLILDFEKANYFFNFLIHNIMVPVKFGQISAQEATELANGLDTSFIPTRFLTFFPLFLLPLFVRRINDTCLHPAFIAPIVIVFVGDFLQSTFGFNFNFRLYDTMDVYNFCLISILCFLPSKKTKEIKE